MKTVLIFKQQIILQTFMRSFDCKHKSINLKLWEDAEVIDVLYLQELSYDVIGHHLQLFRNCWPSYKT